MMWLLGAVLFATALVIHVIEIWATAMIVDEIVLVAVVFVIIIILCVLLSYIAINDYKATQQKNNALRVFIHSPRTILVQPRDVDVGEILFTTWQIGLTTRADTVTSHPAQAA